jgi:mono/diheme cytochrome c family protein
MARNRLSSRIALGLAALMVVGGFVFASNLWYRASPHVDSPVAVATSTAPVTPAGHGVAALDQVRNPYTGQADAIAQGEQLFVVKACSGCHGVAGIGGMCPPLVNDAWVYGSDDATLFNLIKLGSAGLQATGIARIGREKIAGDMPAFNGVVSDDEAWMLLAYVRSKYAGNPSLRNW